MDLNTPELIRVFRDELDERSARLVSGARHLADQTLARDSISDLVRDAHTIKGSAGLLGYEVIREAGTRLETLWRMVAEGYMPRVDVVISMEATAGRLVATLDGQDEAGLAELVEKLDDTLEETKGTTEIVPLRHPDAGDMGGLLTSVSESLLGGATRVDTGDLYKLINRIVEVALDAEALADL